MGRKGAVRVDAQRELALCAECGRLHGRRS